MNPLMQPLVMGFQEKMQSEQKEMELKKAEMEKFSIQITKLVQQTNENELVKQEVDLMEEEAQLYKLIGPGLVPQSVIDVRTNVNSRIDLLKKETTKVENKLKTNRETQVTVATRCEQMQKDFQNTITAMSQQPQE